MCKACSIRCHASHQLVEIGKKYHKCDCGNKALYGDTQCQLIPGQRFDNPHNRYNHNFEGRYCACDKTYDEMTQTDTMYQVRRPS